MVDILGNSYIIGTQSHGFHANFISSNHENKVHVEFRSCNIDFIRKGRTFSNQNERLVINESNSVSMVEQSGWSRFWKKREGKLGFGSCFIRNTAFKSVLVCEEQKPNMPIRRKKENLNMISHKQGLPPLGSKPMLGDSSFDPGGTQNHILEHRLCKANLHFLEERNEEILSKRILILSRANKVRSALELYLSMENARLQATVHACNSLLSCLLRNGLLDDALRIFEMMKKKGTVSGHTCSLILKAVASVWGCDSALKIFMELEGKSVLKKGFDAIVYNTLISICGKENKWDQAERLWKILKQDGYSGTLITYRLLISTFIRCNQTELALDAYYEMIQNGLKPSEDVLKCVIWACAKDGNWALALNVFQQMLDGDLKPNAITYNLLINCLGKSGEVDLAFRIYNHMKSSGHVPDPYTWNALLTALYRANRCAVALQFFESLKIERGAELNVHIYNVALMTCQKLGLWDRSLQLLWQMEDGGMLITTVSYNHVIGACESARKPEVALQVYEHMRHMKCIPDVFTYLSLIRACVWGSLWTEVEEILDHAGPDTSLYNALIHGLCLRGKITSAKKLYSRMRSRGLTPDGKTRALMLQTLTKNSVKRHPRYHSPQN